MKLFTLCTIYILPFLLCSNAIAQQDDPPYTTPNEITINIPGTSINYSYFSSQMRVRLNQETTKIELRVPLSSFTPANTGSPQVLLHELLLARPFPELIIYLDAPADLLLSDKLQPETRRLKGILVTQGISRDIETDVQFVPLPSQVTMSTTFTFNLYGPGVQLPANYTGLVQGGADIVIQNARWINTQKNNR